MYNTKNIHPFFGSYIQVHIHLFVTKSITIFPTSTQAEELSQLEVEIQGQWVNAVRQEDREGLI